MWLNAMPSLFKFMNILFYAYFPCHWLQGGKFDRSLEIETWHDLANIYISMSQWRDAEICLSKLKGISPYSAFGWHATGILTIAVSLIKSLLASFM